MRKITSADKELYLFLADEFYHSEAVLHPIPLKNIENTFNEMITSDTYAIGYILEFDGKDAGYALLAKTFSQESGGYAIWLEELYVLPEFRGKGIGSDFIKFLSSEFEENISRIRLEVEEDNFGAIELYKRLGFAPLEYKQMVKDF